MRFLHSKIVIGGICIVVAAIFAFVMLPGMYKDKGETVKVLKLDHTVPAGTKITEDMLKETEDVFLDDLTLEDLESELYTNSVVVHDGYDFISEL